MYTVNFSQRSSCMKRIYFDALCVGQWLGHGGLIRLSPHHVTDDQDYCQWGKPPVVRPVKGTLELCNEICVAFRQHFQHIRITPPLRPPPPHPHPHTHKYTKVGNSLTVLCINFMNTALIFLGKISMFSLGNYKLFFWQLNISCRPGLKMSFNDQLVEIL